MIEASEARIHISRLRAAGLGLLAGVMNGLIALGGGVLGLALIAFRRAKLPAAIEAHAWARQMHEVASPAPYGVAIGMAALVLLPNLPLTKALTGWLTGG